MALSDVAAVKRRGGLNHATDFNLYRVADETELNVLVAEDLALAEAYLLDRVATTYYTGAALTPTRYNLLFKRAEELIALAFLTMPLKIRRVDGTYWAVDQEGSERFEELIDNEYFRQAELLIQPYLDIPTTAEAPFGLPVMVVTTPVDRASLAPVQVILQDNLDEVNGLVGVWP